MKKVSFSLVILSSLIVSCTTDTIDSIKSANSNVSSHKSEQSAHMMEELTPENPANIYDFAGKIHNDILDAYLTANHQDTTIAQISKQIEAIAAKNEDLILLKSGTNVPVDFIVIQEIINEPLTVQNQTIANSMMTTAAKISISNFMNAIALRENDSYQEIYEFIISYESAVIANDVLNSEEKRIILTISSIIRYSAYYAEKKDKDWGTSGGHRVGSLRGAIDNSSGAIKYSLVTGIIIYNTLTD